MIYRTAPFSTTLNDPYPDFNVTPLFDAEYLRSGTRYRRRSFSGILIGIYTSPTHGYHFKWPWVTLNYLAKYSITRSIARSFCDSRASCDCKQCLFTYRTLLYSIVESVWSTMANCSLINPLTRIHSNTVDLHTVCVIHMLNDANCWFISQTFPSHMRVEKGFRLVSWSFNI